MGALALYSHVLAGNQPGLSAPGPDGELDYVIISHERFLTQARELATYRATSSGDEVANPLAITPDSIYAECAGSQERKHCIRSFLWRMFSENRTSLKYVLLIGDASSSSTDQSGDLLPTHLSDNYGIDSIVGASDNWFVTFSHYDSALSDAPVVPIGRLPVRDTSELRVFLNKLYSFEQRHSHARKACTFLLDGDQYWSGACSQHRFYELGSPLPKLLPPVYDSRIHHSITYEYENWFKARLSTDIMSALDEGNLFLWYFGSAAGVGRKSAWGLRPFFRIDSVQSLLRNQDRFILISFTNEDAAFQSELPTGGEKLLFGTTYGAVAAVGFSLNVFAEHLAEIQQTMLNALELGSVSLGALFHRTVVEAEENGSLRYVTLLGDPAMPIPSATVTLDHEDTLFISAGGSVRVSGRCGTFPDGDLSVHVLGEGTMVDSVSECGTVIHHRGTRPLVDSLKASIADSRFSFTYTPQQATHPLKLSLYAYDEQDEELGAVFIEPSGAGVGGTNANTMASSALRVFGSPDNRMVKVWLEGHSNVSGICAFTVYDISGRRLISRTFYPGRAFKINMHNWPAGLYLIRASISGMELSRKFTIAK